MIRTGTTAQLLRPLLESYAAASPVRTVAVVGNAPLEPSDERAAQIDAADLVFRCNSFVLDEPGNPRCVGTRTNVCVLTFTTNITPYVFRDYYERLYLVPEVGHAWPLGRGRPPARMMSWPADLGPVMIPNDDLGLPIKQEMKRGGERRPAVPTSGTLAVGVARRVFPDAQLLLTGFSFLDDADQKTWRHQYGTEVKIHFAHLLERERIVVRTWLEESGGRVLP